MQITYGIILLQMIETFIENHKNTISNDTRVSEERTDA